MKISVSAIDDLLKSYNQCIQMNPNLLEDSKEKDIVIFLGNTGSGKSTLINFICGKNLEVIDSINTPFGNFGGKIIVAEDQNDKVKEKPLKISQSFQSETLFPEFLKFYENLIPNYNNLNNLDQEILFYDFAGFGDTRGISQNLSNAYFIKKIIENSNRLKIVFVCSIDEIKADRGRSFKELIQIVGNLFSSEELLKSSCLVFTKCLSKDELNQSQIKDFLNMNSLGFYYEKNLVLSFSIPYNSRLDQSERTEILDVILYKLSYIKKNKIKISRLFKEPQINELEFICKNELEMLIKEITTKSNEELDYYYSLKGYPRLQESIERYFNLNPKQIFNLHVSLQEKLKQNKFFEIVGYIISSIVDSVKQNYINEKLDYEISNLTQRFSDYKVIKFKEFSNMKLYRKVGSYYGLDNKGGFINDYKFVENGEPITAWKICHAAAIDSIMFRYGKVWGNKHGGSGGKLSYVKLEEGEKIVKAYVNSGFAVHKIEFNTNKGRKFSYGWGLGWFKSEQIYFEKRLAYITSFYGNDFLYTFDSLIASLNFYEAPFDDY